MATSLLSLRSRLLSVRKAIGAARKIDESVKVDGRTASVLRLSYRSSSM